MIDGKRAVGKKERLFELYAKSLETNSNLNDWFICPLCFKGFQKKDIQALTIEHIVPKALGGKTITLTCWKCNSDFGSKSLAKLQENIRIKETLTGLSDEPLDAKLSSSGYSVSTSFLPGNEVYKLELNPKRSNPQDVESILADFEKGKVEDLNLKFRVGYSRRIENSALLLISHLLLFYQFGYFFLLSNFGMHIRKFLNGEIEDTPLLAFADITDWEHAVDTPAVIICSEPLQFLNHAFVQIPLKTPNQTHVFAGFIPVFPGTKVNEEAYKTKGNIHIKGEYIPPLSELLKYSKFKLPKKVQLTIENSTKD